jgi:hypothetical protein
MESKLFVYFKGQYVQVLMKNLKGSQTMNDGTINRGNIIIEGFLLDEDERHYFLGETPDKVTEALLHNDVVRMFTSELVQGEFVEIDKNNNENESMN